jgi:hypothetical protein
LVTGFSECIDSFFAFGLFAVALRSRFFPPELVDTFEPVRRRSAGISCSSPTGWRRIGGRSAWRGGSGSSCASPRFGVHRMATRRTRPRHVPRWRPDQAADKNFTLTGSKAVTDVDIGAAEFMAFCLAENDRRFAGYDPRLVRPTTMPWLTRLALRFMKPIRRRDHGGAA